MTPTLRDLRYCKRICATHYLVDFDEIYKVEDDIPYGEIGGKWYDLFKNDIPNFIERLTMIDYSSLDGVPDQPTHAVQFTYDGFTDTILAYKKDDLFISFDTGWRISGVGDIIKIWELN